MSGVTSWSAPTSRFGQRDDFVDECKACRERRLRPLVRQLTGYGPCCRDAFFRGMLSRAVREGDRLRVLDLGAVLDALRERV